MAGRRGHQIGYPEKLTTKKTLPIFPARHFSVNRWVNQGPKNKMNIIQFAFRNVFRNRRRSLITLLAIAVGFMAINLFGGYIARIFDGMEEGAIYGEGLGHLTIFKQGFLIEGKVDPSQYMIAADELAALKTLLASNPAIEKVIPKMGVAGLISNGTSSTIFIADSMSPSDFAFLNADYAYTGEGTRITADKPIGVQVGSDLAKMMRVQVGDTLPVMANTLEGQMNALDVEVAGIYNTGSDATNDKYLLMPLELAQSLYDTTAVDRVSLILNNVSQTEPIRAWLAAQLPQINFQADVKSWNELSVFFTKVKNLMNVIFIFIFSIVLVIVVIGVINTMTMSVVERTQEIGTLRALGLRRRDVLRIFGAEGFMLGVLGVVFGALGTVIVTVLINVANISYFPPGVAEAVPIEVAFAPVTVIASGVFLALLSWGAAIFPSFKASRLRIVDAFGHV